MARRRAVDEDEEEDDDDASPTPPVRSRARGRPRNRPAVRRWSDEEEPAEAPKRGGRRSPRGDAETPTKEPVYFRARDSVYFEPLVALAIIVVLLVGLFAYTQNWPPMYVVESDSMQHGTSDQLGLINTGDLVLAQKVSLDQITPYMVGAQTGYSTYGEYGDVILYHANGQSTGAPIIHRALLYIVVTGNQTYSFPQLQGQSCGATLTDPVYSVSIGPVPSCQTSNVPGSATLTLYHIGWRSVQVIVTLSSLGTTSGFLTMGDNNFVPASPNEGNPDEPFLTDLVQPAWIVGVARGMLPWFGAFKLLIDGDSSEVPSQSWTYLGLTLVGVVVAALLLHLFLRAEGIQDVRRQRARDAERDAQADEEEDDDGDDDGSRHRSWGQRLRGWRHPDDVPGEAEPTHRQGRTSFGGRPRPEVGRKAKRNGHAARADDDDESL